MHENRRLESGERARPKSRRSPPRRVDRHGDVFEPRPVGETFEAVKPRRGPMADRRVGPTAQEECLQPIEPLLFGVIGFVSNVDAPTDSSQSLSSGLSL